jgi:hypothetical protein
MLGSAWAERIEQAELDMLDPDAPVVMVSIRPWPGARWRRIDRRVLQLRDMVGELWPIVLAAKYGGSDVPPSPDWAMPDEDLVLLRQLAEIVNDLGILVSPRTDLYRMLRDSTRALLWSAGDPSSRRAKAAMNQSFEDMKRRFLSQMQRPLPADVPRRGNLYLVR